MRRTFDIMMCVAWLIIAIIYAVLTIEKIDVPAWNVVWPCGLCAGYYFDKIFDRRDR